MVESEEQLPYSDYFNDMTTQLQNEIIARTENEAY